VGQMKSASGIKVPSGSEEREGKETISSAPNSHTVIDAHPHFDAGQQRVRGQMDRLESKKRKLETELANLMKAVATGLDSFTIRGGIADRERQIRAIHDQIISSEPESVKTKISDTRKFAMSSLKDIRRLLASDSQTAKSVVARHMPQIVMKPIVKPDGQKVYQVVSEWALLKGGLELNTSESKGPKGAREFTLAPLVHAEGQS
jgi:hypothetical protein